MLFTDPTSARIIHGARIIEARQARTPHKQSAKGARHLTAGSRVRSLLGSLRRSSVASPSPLTDAHELFAGHDPEQLMRLGRIFTVVDVRAGTALGQQGRIAREFVTILDGEVGVTIDGIPHAVLDGGSHFGAVPLLADAPGEVHSASFTVMTPSRVAVANAAEFQSMLSGFPLIAQRVRAMTDVRRAYLAGLAHESTAEQSIPYTPTITEYPVHAIQFAQHA